jgi:hypothetical protein
MDFVITDDAKEKLNDTFNCFTKEKEIAGNASCSKKSFEKNVFKI